MSFELDWTALGATTNPRTDRLAFDEVKHMFKKVAWDAYKPLSGSDILWELREEDDGKFLYAIYGDENSLVTTASVSSNWTAISDHDGKNITLSYSNVPIKRFSSVEYGFQPSEVEEFASFLKAKAEQKDFVSELLKTLPESKQVAVARLINQRGA